MAVGDAVGVAEGMAVGVTVVIAVGDAEGMAVGDDVGVAVGVTVGDVVPLMQLGPWQTQSEVVQLDMPPISMQSSSSSLLHVHPLP